MEYTNHILERKSRHDVIMSIGGYGKIVDTFYWDKGHKNGPEIHAVTSNAIIIIYNYYTHKAVTSLIARPGQIERYYVREGKEPPKNIMDIAREHQNKGLNFC